MRGLDSYPSWISVVVGAMFLCAAVAANAANHTVVGLCFAIMGVGLLVPRRKSPLTLWSVRFLDGNIVTGDGRGAERRLPLRDLRRVVVATDDSGPLGADVMFLLYSDAPDPAAIFPLEATGRDDFVKWLTDQPGYQDRELAKAMGWTQVARFEVLAVPPNGS